jgi:hypothetical protein
LPCPAGSFEGGNTGGNAAGDISIAYSQFPAPNDNSYGTNAVGWPSGHTFNNLTGSDKAGFQILRPNGTIAVSFNIDYISASTLNSPPSGYRSLGPFGGDGGIVVNSTPALVNNGTQITWDTSFARDLNGPAVWGAIPTWPTPTYFVGGVQTAATLPPATNGANLLSNSPPVDCSMATDPNCIIQYGVPKGIQYPLAVPNPWTASYNNPEYTTSGGPIPTGSRDPAHVDGWNFQDMFFVTFKAAYLTAIGFDFSNYDIADFDPATNTFTCDPNKWCIAPNPTALHNSPAKPCPSVSPSPTPTPTPCVCALTVTARAVSSKTVTITIRNDGCADEFITNLALSWPQGINGNLTKIKLDGDTLWTGATGSPINFGVPPLTADANKRKIKKGESDKLIFEFQNNAAPLNNAAYSGSATFQSGCQLDFGLPTP